MSNTSSGCGKENKGLGVAPASQPPLSQPSASAASVDATASSQSGIANAVCAHGICHPWQCSDCDEAALAQLHRAAPDLYRELQALVTAVCFADPPKVFNGVECHEARVPTAFIDGARAALSLARGERND